MRANTPITKKFSCKSEDPRQLRLSKNPPFRQMIQRVIIYGQAKKAGRLILDDDSRYQLEQKIYEKTGIMVDWEEGLACGSFGCAFETDHPEVVVKVTEDFNEAAGAMALLGTRRWWPGVIGIHNVFKHQEQSVYVLLTERVGNMFDPVTFVQDYYVPNEEEITLGFKHLLEYSNRLLQFLEQMQRAAITAILHRKIPIDAEFYEDWTAKFVGASRTYWNQMLAMSNTYRDLWNEFKIVFPDVHAGNIGFRVYDGPSGVGPTCVKWDTDEDDDLPFKPQGPELLCLDLGLSAGSGIVAAKKKRLVKLNPLMEPYINLIPEL